MKNTAPTFMMILALTNLAWADSGIGEHRSPGDMTADERGTMMKSANDYNNCVYMKALEIQKSEADIRRVADLAMGACQSHLDELSGSMSAWGFDQSFATGFTNNVKNRAARKIIPELAIRSSN